MSEQIPEELRRYARQIGFGAIGLDGQKRLAASDVLVVGCGALGGVSAEQLARAGVGSLRIVDRDLIELHNLQRQPLFSEADIEEGLPKAKAAERRLRAVNGEISVRGYVDDFNAVNASRYTENADLIIDGTDNFETRQLINDVALSRGIPWIYGGAMRADGVVKAVVPGRTSCLRCLLGGIPPLGEADTCETAGIIAPAAAIVASLQVSLALKLLIGEPVSGDLLIVDAWRGAVRSVASPRLPDCPACAGGKYSFLDGSAGGGAAVLCGRDAVQVSPAQPREINLESLAERLASLGAVRNRRYYLEFDAGTLQLSIFPDGRTIVKGTDDGARARAAVAKYLGG